MKKLYGSLIGLLIVGGGIIVASQLLGGKGIFEIGGKQAEPAPVDPQTALCNQFSGFVSRFHVTCQEMYPDPRFCIANYKNLPIKCPPNMQILFNEQLVLGKDNYGIAWGCCR